MTMADNNLSIESISLYRIRNANGGHDLVGDIVFRTRTGLVTIRPSPGNAELLSTKIAQLPEVVHALNTITDELKLAGL